MDREQMLHALHDLARKAGREPEGWVPDTDDEWYLTGYRDALQMAIGVMSDAWPKYQTRVHTRGEQPLPVAL